MKSMTELDKSVGNGVNPFHASGLFWYPLKTSENLWFSDVFRGYQKRTVAWNGLTTWPIVIMLLKID